MNCNEEIIKIDETHPQIYIACLSAYNNGYLHGAWIDASEGIEHVKKCLKEILASSPMAKEGECEEWAIHDYQGFGNYNVEEYHDLEKLCEVAEFLTKNESFFPLDVISSLINDYGPEGAKEKLECDYIGEFDNFTDLAYFFVAEEGLLDNVDKTVAMYFDYEAFGRDLELGGDVMNFGYYYFWNR